MPASATSRSCSVRANATSDPPKRTSFAAAGEPFHSAEEAWLWTAAALTARRDGARVAAGRGRVQRPCEPDDVVRVLDRLFASHTVTLAHARILNAWGRLQQAPDPTQVGQQADHRLGLDCLALIEPPLRARGLIG